MESGRSTVKVIALWGEKPGLTDLSRKKLFSIKPAPVSKTSARAISEIVRTPRIPSWLAVTLRPPWLNDSRAWRRVV
jgi:hypothetical protein